MKQMGPNGLPFYQSTSVLKVQHTAKHQINCSMYHLYTLLQPHIRMQKIDYASKAPINETYNIYIFSTSHPPLAFPTAFRSLLSQVVCNSLALPPVSLCTAHSLAFVRECIVLAVPFAYSQSSRFLICLIGEWRNEILCLLFVAKAYTIIHVIDIVHCFGLIIFGAVSLWEKHISGPRFISLSEEKIGERALVCLAKYHWSN